MRIKEDRLVAMALVVLEEVAATCHHRPVPRSRALALVLAYLAARGAGDRCHYDSFWRSVDHPRSQDRWSGVNASLNGIYLSAGVKRDTAIVSIYEQRARKALGVE
ncbi:MAG: hypothetical protein ABI454_00485 [Sphingomicrobium sp.]